MHVQQDSVATPSTPEQSFETVRSLFGFDITFRAEEIIDMLDADMAAEIKQADRDHRNEIAFCTGRREIDAAHQRHAAAVTAISKKHAEDIERVNQWDRQRAVPGDVCAPSVESLHDRHEKRDEEGEARAAAAMGSGEGVGL